MAKGYHDNDKPPPRAEPPEEKGVVVCDPDVVDGCHRKRHHGVCNQEAVDHSEWEERPRSLLKNVPPKSYILVGGNTPQLPPR